MEAAGIVLAGGRSSRMGTAKAALPWHGATLLHRTVSVLARVVTGPVIVVCAPDQDLPELPVATTVLPDPIRGLGPLQGLAAGLTEAAGRADVAFVTATDLPFLHPAFVQHMLRALTAAKAADVAMAHTDGRRQPLAAAYRTSLVEVLDTLLAARRLSFADLLNACRAIRIGRDGLLADDALAAADPYLDSLVNVNTQAEYDDARARSAPEVTVIDSGTTERVRAATLARAAAAVAVPLDRDLPVTLNGHPIPADGRVPLVRGDVIRFPSPPRGPERLK